jgi:hypothetical protein
VGIERVHGRIFLGRLLVSVAVGDENEKLSKFKIRKEKNDPVLFVETTVA